MMYKIDSLVLMTGADIILKEPSVRIHQPTIKEIAFIGEDKFFKSMNIFYISPEPLTDFIIEADNIAEEDKQPMIDSITIYDSLLFLLQIATEEKLTDIKIIDWVETFFALILTDYNFVFNSEEGVILLMSQNDSDSIVVDRELFMQFREIAIQIFLLKRFFDNGVEKSMSKAAQKIANKMAESERKIKKSKNEEEEDSQLSRIVSILGINKQLDYLNNLTIYQLFNQFERFNLFTNYDQALKATLAGASNVELVDWYKKI